MCSQSKSESGGSGSGVDIDFVLRWREGFMEGEREEGRGEVWGRGEVSIDVGMILCVLAKELFDESVFEAME